ncbi:hypothetical protein RRSWK_00796 [Rhodopirellula sp. SWK7]|nr:hypothetical protein RRSWK_00796 [Rhodopirellula sp. SWK7]
MVLVRAINARIQCHRLTRWGVRGRPGMFFVLRHKHFVHERCVFML